MTTDENYVAQEYKKFVDSLHLDKCIPLFPSCLLSLILRHVVSLESHYFLVFKIAPWMYSWKSPAKIKDLPNAVQELELRIIESYLTDSDIIPPFLDLSEWIHDFRKFSRVTFYADPRDPSQMIQPSIGALLKKRLESKKTDQYAREYEQALVEMINGLEQKYRTNAKLILHCP
jgi:hypothetical protein